MNSNVRFLPEYFRFTPESGHSEGSREMSGYDPKQTTRRITITEQNEVWHFLAMDSMQPNSKHRSFYQ